MNRFVTIGGMETPTGPGPAAAPSPAFDALRRAWAQELRGQKTDLATLGLADAERPVVELGLELLRFAQAIDVGVTYFLLELNVGPALSTLQMKGYGQTVASRASEVLAGNAAGLDGLRRILERNRKFLLDLNESYREAIPAGVQRLLAETAPRGARERHLRFFGLLGGPAALAALGTQHADLAASAPEDLLQRFFVEPFQRELARRLGMESR